jgi:hypothetical protein
MTTPLSSLAIWPGFAKDTKPVRPLDRSAALTGSNDKWLTTNGGAFVEGATPDFVVSGETVQADAALAAKMWLKHPSYKMTLAATQQGVDVNNDGLIDKDEFKELLAASGYRGAAAAELFRQMDKDGDGTLTEAEIKLLSQGSATLQSSG